MTFPIDIAGLVATSAPQTSTALEELLDYCGWPVVLKASPRRLSRELAMRRCRCLLFWLEELRHANATTGLIEWLSEREPHIFRVAIAYRLGAEIESAVRRAGVQSFIHAQGDMAAVVDDVLWPQLAAANIRSSTEISPASPPTPLGHESFIEGVRASPAQPP